MAVVVNQTSIRFYTDAKLQRTVSLRRPVTDCTGRALIIGAPDVPGLGEITFFPRQISVVEMQEISQQGFTFESLAAGRLPFQPEKSAFDTANAVQDIEFAEAKVERKVIMQKVHLESVFTRMETNAVSNPPINAYQDLSQRAHITVPPVPNCKTLKIFGSTTSAFACKESRVETSRPAATTKSLRLCREDTGCSNFRVALLSENRLPGVDRSCGKRIGFRRFSQRSGRNTALNPF